MAAPPKDRLQHLAGKGGRAFWRGFDELADDGAVRAWLAAEFPSAVTAGRRDVLKALAASAVTASLAGCGPAPERPAVPYVNQPVDYVPGLPRWFATAIPFDGIAQPVLAECHAGRPTRLDGNPQHPASRGAIDAFTQAAILQLYDPERSAAVTYRGRIAPWGSFDAAVIGAVGRLKQTGGQGFRLLTGPESSPTLMRQIAALKALYPNLRWHGLVSDDGARAEASRRAFGRPLAVTPRLDTASVVICLEDDPLGPGAQQVSAAAAWSVQRRNGQGLPLLFVAESTPSLTGAMAHRRLVAASARIAALAAALAGQAVGLDDAEAAWVGAVRQAVADHPGGATISAGAHQPVDVQALCMGLAERWGGAGRTVGYTDPVVAEPDAGVADLVGEMQAGQVSLLVMAGVNPVYAAPGVLDFAQALARVPLSVHAGAAYDETAALCQWHVPLAHPLESWSDGRAVDGSATILQPLIAPLHQGRSLHQLVEALLDRPGAEALAPVRETWRGQMDEAAWCRALEAGRVEGSAFPPVTVVPRPPSVLTVGPAAAGSEVVFRPDPGVWDGRFADCAWLQELPKPLTKVVWDAPIALSRGLARRLGVANGETVAVELGGRELRGPAWILPGQAAETVTLFLGYGRQRGRAAGLGYDAHALRPPTAAPSYAATVRKAGGGLPVVSTQLHHAVDGADLVRVVAPGDGVEESAETTPGHPDRPSLYPRKPPAGKAWGMVIDTDLCIGCNACVIACQAENNIPSVGRAQVAMGREMHWLRIDRYYEGEADHPFTHFQPVPCMHCENAPCELGCPVNATVHSPEGVNEMVYNRCIGTRTCASYCPYKVRRFNYAFYSRQAPPLEWAERNPEVTVRARGVMEKCTYCVQRIERARIDADREGRDIPDGAVRTACQNACPTTAIVFGDLADPASAVARQRGDRRNYGLLDELNTWPRTTYLARIRRKGADNA